MPLTLYHAPGTRSSRILTLLDELGAMDDVNIEIVTVQRHDGTGARDPKNPHPEGKVPYLVHDGFGAWESPAIVQYLADLYPRAGLAPQIGDPLRASYLSWLHYYGGVMEPVVHFSMLGLDDPMLRATFRGQKEMVARLEDALSESPFLLGDNYSAADLLIHSPFAWFSTLMPDSDPIREWVARCAERPSARRTVEFDERFAVKS